MDGSDYRVSRLEGYISRLQLRIDALEQQLAASAGTANQAASVAQQVVSFVNHEFGRFAVNMANRQTERATEQAAGRADGDGETAGGRSDRGNRGGSGNRGSAGERDRAAIDERLARLEQRVEQVVGFVNQLARRMEGQGQAKRQSGSNETAGGVAGTGKGKAGPFANPLDDPNLNLAGAAERLMADPPRG
jgi:hypothetical protein